MSGFSPARKIVVTTNPKKLSADTTTTLNMMNAQWEGLGRMLGRKLLNVLFEC